MLITTSVLVEVDRNIPRKEVKDFTLLEPHRLNSTPSRKGEISSLELVDILYFF